MKGSVFTLVGAALLAGSIVAWSVTLFGSTEGGNPYWVHLSGQCAKECVPSPAEYSYAFITLVLSPVLSLACLSAGRRRRLARGNRPAP